MTKIVFKYSWIYDDHFMEIAKNKERYPSLERIEAFIKRAEKLWRKDEKRILAELPRITRLKWKEEKITCYVVGKCIPFSEPLTLPIMENYPDYFIDVLVHELLHQLLFVQNEEETKEAWDYIFKKYRKGAVNTKIHIPVHAFHSHIYLKFFGERRMKRDIKLISFLPDYKKSWEIVQKEGYRNIMNEFAKRIQ